MYKVEALALEGCKLITPSITEDVRGKVIKPFQCEGFREIGIGAEFTEDLVVFNKERVLRGMHFQAEPYAQEKLVYCLQGKIRDILLDLRRDSPTFAQHISIELTGTALKMLYVPKGIAHGYYCMLPSVVCYKLSSFYSKEHERGIAWDCCGVNWIDLNPIISEKDKSYPSLSTYIEQH